ncbi:MAG: translocation/assembly module TamB domain-containing protein [Desulfobulbus sp.]|nr:translocation/assembly module TamB domain-containing protein [Desulfobulbus sp.]
MKNKGLLSFSGLSFLLVLALILFLAATESGLHCLILAGNRLSGGLLTIGAASGTMLGPIRLQDIRYADGIDTVLISAVDLDWEPARLLDGKLRIHSVRGRDVRILLGESTGETVLTPFSLPVDLTIDTVSADTITVFSDQEPVWTIAQGTASDLSYRKTAIHVAGLSLISDAFTLQVKGSLRTDDAYPLQADVIFRAHPNGYEPIAAQGTFSGPLNGLILEADAEMPFPMHLDGRIDRLLADTTWQAQLTVPEMALPGIRRDWPEQRFAQVVINGQGTLSNYALHVQSQAGLPALTALSTLAADIRGDGNGFVVDNLELDHGTARLSVKGNLTWSPRFSWQSEVNGTHLDPGLFFADWPGDFTGSLTTSGHTTEQGWHVTCAVPSVQGTLRGFPLTGNGELSIADNQIRLPLLHVKSGNSVLRASGLINEVVDLDFRLDSNNVAELWPGAHGTIKAQGRVTGPQKKPQINIRLDGNNLSWGTYGLQTLSIEANGIAARNESLEILAQAKNLRLSTEMVDAVHLKFKGSLEDHTLELNGENKEFSAGVSLQGALRDNRWQATLSRSHIASQRHGNWQQQQPTALTWSADSIEVKPLCLQAASAGTLCVDGSWQVPSRAWRAHGTASSLPLEPLMAGQTLTWPLIGQLNAEVDLAGQQDRLLTGTMSSSVDGMQLHLSLPDGNTQQVTWQKNVFSARYAGNRLQATFASEFTDKGAIHAELTATGDPFTPETFLRAPVNGSLRFNLRDLSPLSTLTGHMVHLTGALHGQLTVNGMPSSPVVNGQVNLAEGQVEIPPLGITLSSLQLTMASDGRSARLVANAQSGEGWLRAESVLQLGQLTTGTHSVHFSGDGFKAAHLPGLDLDASPDLTLLFGAQKMAIRGTVAIPRARITSIDFHQATIASDDMVIIDEEDTSAGAAVPLFTDITVIAGDDVRVDAYGLKGAITGKLAINGQSGRPQIGNGTLSVHDGSFTIYGRRLRIDLGRLHFAGGPLTNPGIELRSEKKSERVTTGVLVSGFLQKPEVQFYSSPVLEQSAIITNLLESTAIAGETRQDTGFLGTAATNVGLGGMVPYLQGIKQLAMIDEIKLDAGDAYDSLALVFGSWLTPDFYVSYGKDLVKESGRFNTRYTLGKGFSLLTETGESHSGGDIKYEFER